MIKYFSYELDRITGKPVNINILYEEPNTDDDGYSIEYIKYSENILSS